MTTRLIHLSDLHFGRDRPELMRPLITAINDQKPDLIAISGDLTQRARASQFRAARAFIDHLEAPVIAVPGNHDLPVHRPFRRFVTPFAGYRKHISDDLSPALMTPDVAVIGINTMTPWRWQRGWATRTQVRRAARLCRTGPAHRLNVIVAHHPFELPPDSDKSPMINGEWGLQILAEAGADVVLSGHLHRWHVIAPPGPATAEILQIHCGTGLSTRMRGEPNDFAMLDIGSPSSDSDLTVTRWIAGPDNSFTPRETTRFHRGPDGWRNPAEDADRPLQF